MRQAAQTLFENYNTANVDGRLGLSLEDAQTFLADLTVDQFTDLDTDDDGILARAELATETLPPIFRGCFNDTETLTTLKDFLGDIFLVYLLATTLIAWRRITRRP